MGDVGEAAVAEDGGEGGVRVRQRIRPGKERVLRRVATTATAASAAPAGLIRAGKGVEPRALQAGAAARRRGGGPRLESAGNSARAPGGGTVSTVAGGAAPTLAEKLLLRLAFSSVKRAESSSLSSRWKGNVLCCPPDSSP